MRELRLLEKQLKSLRQQCHTVQEAKHCGILSGLTQAARHRSATESTTGNTPSLHHPHD